MDNYNTEKEVWKDIEGYEGRYQVSNLGRVKSLKRKVPNGENSFRIIKEKILKTSKKSNEYIKVNLSGKSYRVHRLVATAFIENPNNYDEINHINGDKRDNRVKNLEWCTREYNMSFNKKLNVMPKGSEHKNSTITEQVAREIKILLNKGHMQKDIANKFNTTVNIVSQINRGLTWKHIDV